MAALEDTHSVAFKTAVATLEAQWQAQRQGQRQGQRQALPLNRWQARIQFFAEAANPADYAQDVFKWNDQDVKIHYAPSHRLTVQLGKKKYADLTAFFVDRADGSNLYATIKDVGGGSERMELAVYRDGTAAPLFTHSPVGPDAAFCGDRIAYLTVDNALRYDCVVTVDKATGRAKRTLYESKDKRNQLELLNPPRQDEVFVREYNALDRRIGYLTEHTVRWMTPAKPTTMIPLSKTSWVENRHLVVGDRRIPLPHGEFAEDAAPWGDEVLLVTVKDACCSLYEWGNGYTTLLKSDQPNQIRLSSYGPTAVLSYPNAPTEVWDLHDVRSILTFPEPLRLSQSAHGHATSKDGTRIPYTIVSASKSPTKLAVEAYGAYGISGHRSYPVKWLAYLERGYAVAVVFPRGGRENGDAWWQGGSTAPRKHKTFEDVYAAIKAVQRRLRIPIEKTLFYGRSAGGWAAARVAQHEPPLVAAVLAEVPYVDVLRTTSNPRLPLTQMEYEEFGDPRRPADYAALQQISPIDTVRPAAPGAPAILVRTALHDMEVSPYEAIKWVTKLQAHGWNAVLALDRDGGHFAASSKMGGQAAENAAWLDAVLSKRRSSQTRKASRSAPVRMPSSTRRRKH